MKSIRLPLFAAAAASLALIVGAQEPPHASPPQRVAEAPPADVLAILEGRSRPLIRLAFPDIDKAPGMSGETAAAAGALEETLRQDLEWSRYFQIQGAWAFSLLETTGELARDLEQYRSLGNEFLLQGEIRLEGDGKIALDGRLYDLRGGEVLLGRRYRGNLRVARRIAHTFADEVVRALTGREGIAQTRIAFTSDRTGFKEILVMDYDGENVRPLTQHKSTSMSPDWSPTGEGVAYVSFFEGKPAIYFAELPSGRKSDVVTDGLFNISPSFSPDGRRIAFTRAVGGNSEIFVIDRARGKPRRLTHSGAIDANPAWSPRGGDIAFTSSRTGNPHIYVMDADGANLRRVSRGGTYNDGASWRPEGDSIVYATRIGGVFQIVLTNLSTGEDRFLTKGRGSKEDPSFSPDGRHVVYTSNQTGSKQIWRVDLDGGNHRRLTRAGNNESPSWSRGH